MVDLCFTSLGREIISDIKSPIELAEDGRCDSPGYSANYGTYTVLDTDTNKMIDFSIMHIGSVALGNAMHKQGLINCIESLESREVNIKC